MSHRIASSESPTEQRNLRTTDLDRLPTTEILQMINTEDSVVPGAVRAALPQLARAVDWAADTLRAGGRIHYVGAGTSGRLATLDAVELVPTFDVPQDWFVAHHAGGERGLRRSVANAEDDASAGARELTATATADDFVLGLTASGRTPYVLGALRGAKQCGARTGLVSANPTTSGSPDIDVLIAVDTGPEAIAGSTRMKAGTAQKTVLTTFSTAVMVKLGRTYSNLMVSVQATNEKLRGRTIRILREATGLAAEECAAALAQADGDVRASLLHLLSGAEIPDAVAALSSTGGHVRAALESLQRLGEGPQNQNSATRS